MIVILLCAYAALHGITNAFLYSRKGADALPTNEHLYLVYERAAVFVGPFMGVIIGSQLGFYWGFIVCAAEEAAAVLLFSWFHNGAYYLTRDRIDGTSHGFKHTSPTTTAKLDFTYKQRRTMAYVGVWFIWAFYSVAIFFAI